ncbi:MAG TPA: DUF4012 domain-containing protein [Candidatus Pacebacteria bacterium]|nr:DUF4012 domain-containing protein [Candidatus Paceibacterota bacterium]
MKKIVIIIGIITLVGGGIFWYANSHKGAVLNKTIQSVDNVLKFDQLDEDTREQFGVIQDIANIILAQDDVTRRYLVLLQNNLELRPGGGFIGQYAVFEVKNGEILSYVVKDSNVLDKTYKSDRELPASLQKYLVGTRKWKFRDSNYSPDYPTNVSDALHFYGLSGEDAEFDGVIAVNATLFEDILDITGPISLTEKDYEKYGDFTSDGGLMKLQKIVEEPFFRADERKECEKALKKANVPEDDSRWKDCQYDENGKKKKKVTHGQRVARKYILDVIAREIVPKLSKISNIEPIIKMVTQNLNEKDIQLWFKNENLQKIASDAKWTGEVDEDWSGDYVMISDTNVGALKSDYYMKRSMEYKVDFTGKSAEANDVNAGRMVRYISDDIKEQVMSGTFVTSKPLATVRMIYENTATQASNYNMDYHSFTRLYVPNGSKWYVREWFEPPGLDVGVFGDKQVYGYKFDVLLGDTIPTMLQYTLPDTITEDGYKLKIQKQSGIGNIPLKVTIITSNGNVYTKEVDFKHDMVFELQDTENGKELIIVE